MDDEIQFGDVEESRPEVQLRPDANKHYAVAPVFSPNGVDLPVFVDLDVMDDMEDHALSDTRVELGGVMLGGQYEDEDGNAFVVVTDSLRAEHYESTKGSFKFTHDTWSEITRQRDEFPDELQMVGWYHTHPDWGVFLSGMDMFICDNFFNKTLDVALVIDPCRQDRGFFQWTGDPTERVRRTGGFYLISSRFRQDELEDYAAFLEGQYGMAPDSRHRGSAPVVNIAGMQSSWQNTAVLGILLMQFCFLMLIGWRTLVPQVTTESEKKRIAALERTIERMSQVRDREALVNAKVEALDQLFSRSEGNPRRLASRIVEQEAELASLKHSLRAEQENQDTLVGQLDRATKSAEARASELDRKVDRLTSNLDKEKKWSAGLSRRLEKYEPVKSRSKKSKDSDEETEPVNWWLVGPAMAIAVLVVVALVVSAGQQRQEQQESGGDSDEVFQ